MGDEGTLHYQAYVEMKQPTRLTGMKKLFPRAHLEVRKGSRKQAVQYCGKDESRIGDTSIYVNEKWINSSGAYGTDGVDEWTTLWHSLTSQETSTTSTKQRLSLIKDQLCAGSHSIEEIADNDFDLWVRYYRAFERYVMIKTEPRNHEVEVHVVQGPTGTGKSKWAMETYPGAYWKQRSNWWDGYTKHDAVIIDEFYGWLPFDLLLRICDRYPLMVESKGGQIQFVAKTIVITSNQLPGSWYKSCYFPSFIRRVKRWHIMPLLGFHMEYDDYPTFLKHASENILNL